MSFSKATLTPFLSPLPPTTPDNCVVLPDSGRCELAVRQRFVGRSDPGVAALDQEIVRQTPSFSGTAQRGGDLYRWPRTASPGRACNPVSRLALRSALPMCLPLGCRRLKQPRARLSGLTALLW